MQVTDFYCYRIKPAKRPTAASMVAALVSSFIPRAPLPSVEPGALVLEVPVVAGVFVGRTAVEKPEAVGAAVPGTEAPPVAVAGGADAPPEGAAVVPALAAAWKASKDFSAVGLIAKTIPA